MIPLLPTLQADTVGQKLKKQTVCQCMVSRLLLDESIHQIAKQLLQLLPARKDGGNAIERLIADTVCVPKIEEDRIAAIGRQTAQLLPRAGKPQIPAMDRPLLSAEEQAAAFGQIEAQLIAVHRSQRGFSPNPCFFGVVQPGHTDVRKQGCFRDRAGFHKSTSEV